MNDTDIAAEIERNRVREYTDQLALGRVYCAWGAHYVERAAIAVNHGQYNQTCGACMSAAGS